MRLRLDLLSSDRLRDPSQPDQPRQSLIAQGKGRPLGVVSLALDPSPSSPPRYALTNTLDATLSRWNLEDGTREAKREFTAAEAWSIAAHPSAEAELVAVSGSSARVRVLRSSVEGFGEQVHSLESRGKFAMCCAYSPDGTLLACGTDSGQVSVFDTQTGSLVQSFLGPSRGFSVHLTEQRMPLPFDRSPFRPIPSSSSPACALRLVSSSDRAVG